MCLLKIWNNRKQKQWTKVMWVFAAELYLQSGFKSFKMFNFPRGDQTAFKLLRCDPAILEPEALNPVYWLDHNNCYSMRVFVGHQWRAAAEHLYLHWSSACALHPPALKRVYTEGEAFCHSVNAANCTTSHLHHYQIGILKVAALSHRYLNKCRKEVNVFDFI